MRAFKAAFAIFLLLVLAIAVNAAYIKHTGELFSTQLEQLPAQASADALTEVRKLRAHWKKAQGIINISVGYCETDRFDELLLSIEAYCTLGNTEEYRRTIALAQNAARDLSRLEQLSLINIF